MNTCDSCRYWKRITHHRGHPLPRGVLLGDCKSPEIGYGYQIEMSEVKPAQIIVENDEGWGLQVGPKFGCVHWASPAVRT